MDLKECLTNEKIAKKFSSQFELVNYAIKLAENMIVTGRDPRVRTNTQNRSLQVLSEILNNKDRLDEVIVEEIEETEVEFHPHASEKAEEPEAPKATEKKRSRKALAG